MSPDDPTPDDLAPADLTPADSRRDASRTGEASQGGLPADAGNGMSGRSEWTGESESGETNTPNVTDSPARIPDRTNDGIPTLTGDSDDGTSTGTTFGTGGRDDKGM